MDCPNLPVIAGSELFRKMKENSPDQRIPFSGSFELTYRCNMRCVHCYQGERRFDHQPDELSTEEIFRITDEIAAQGCLYLLITGGEPFVRPDLYDILRYVKRKGILVTLFTNGTRIDQAAIDRLMTCMPNKIEITLYGLTQETYEAVTGIPGSYRRCMQGIELLHRHQIPYALKTMVMTTNFHELAGMKAFAESLGVKFRYDAMLHAELDHGKDPHKYRLTPEQVIEADQVDPVRLEKKRQAWAKLCGKEFSHEYQYHCGAGIDGFHIDPNGRLSLCMMVRDTWYDLRQGSFRDGWQTFLKEHRFAKSTRYNPCIDCELFAMCGECPGRAKIEQDSPESPNWYYCQVAHMRLENSLIANR